MLLNIFEKKIKYIYFDALKNKVIRKNLTEQEIQEISEHEFKEDCYIFNENINQLVENINKLEQIKLSDFNNSVFSLLHAEISNLSTLAKTLTTKDLKNYQKLMNSFRELFKTYISLITNQSWQAPDFGYSLDPQHGLFQEKIYSFYNDYQRYRIDTKEIENRYNLCYKNINNIKHQAYLFNSGMGAFTSLLNSFTNYQSSIKIAGKNLYFEVFSILKQDKNITFFDEKDIDSILTFIENNHPDYLFFDPVANSGHLPCCDFEKLFAYYQKNPPDKPVSVMIDITLCVHFFQINKFLSNSFPGNLNVFLYRSLQKLDQQGLDLVTGGLIIHYGNLNLLLDSFRQMGTMPTEVETATLEKLGIKNIEPKLLRHSRNALLIADYLANLKDKPESIIDKVFHPLLNSEPESFFQVPLLFFSLKEHFNLEDNNAFLQELLKAAKAGEISLIAGTSFGFNCSRIMITTFPNSSIICFRFSPGTETLQEVYKLLNIFTEVTTNFVQNLKNLYEKENLGIYKNKKEHFNNFINTLSQNELDYHSFKKITLLLNDLKNSLDKFRYYKNSKIFYFNILEQLSENFLKALDKLQVANELKKEIIRFIADFNSPVP